MGQSRQRRSSPFLCHTNLTTMFGIWVAMLFVIAMMMSAPAVSLVRFGSASLSPNRFGLCHGRLCDSSLAPPPPPPPFVVVPPRRRQRRLNLILAAFSPKDNDNDEYDDTTFVKRMQQRRGESTMDFLRRLQKEDLFTDDNNDDDNSNNGASKSVASSDTSMAAATYQRVEDWDAAQGNATSWEERVQFDGQRFGDRFKQDGILRKHLGM